MNGVDVSCTKVPEVDPVSRVQDDEHTWPVQKRKIIVREILSNDKHPKDGQNIQQRSTQELVGIDNTDKVRKVNKDKLLPLFLRKF